MSRVPRALAGLAAGCAALAGCGGGDTPSAGPGAAATPPAAVVGTPPAEPSAPEVEPAGREVTRLRVRELRRGSGAAARSGATVRMRYVAVEARSGREVDSTYSQGAPFEAVLGQGLLPAGLERGLIGMRAGARRRIEVPRRLSAQGRALVYVVDLVRVL